MIIRDQFQKKENTNDHNYKSIEEIREYLHVTLASVNFIKKRFRSHPFNWQ